MSEAGQQVERHSPHKRPRDLHCEEADVVREVIGRHLWGDIAREETDMRASGSTLAACLLQVTVN